VVLEVGRLLVLCGPEVDGNDLVGDVALFSHEGHAPRGRAQGSSINLE